MKRFVSFCMAAVLLSVAVWTFSDRTYVEAGVSKSDLYNDTAGGAGLGNDIWFTDNDGSSGASYQGNAINFTAKKADSRFNLKSKIYDLSDAGIQESFSLSTDVIIKALPNGVRFGFMFGLPALLATAGDRSSSYLYFVMSDGKLCVGLSNFDNASAESTAYPATEIGGGIGLNSRFTLSLRVTNDGVATFSVAGLSGQAENVYTEGYAGFGQKTSGSLYSSAQIIGLKVVGYKNDTPENTDYFEDFDLGCFNTRVFQTISRAGGLPGSALEVKDKALSFNNTGEASLITSFQYSNVQLSFDITHVQREPVYSDGNIIKTISSAFAIGFGTTDIQEDGIYIEIRPVGGSAVKKGDYTSAALCYNREELLEIRLPDRYDIFGAEQEQIISVMASYVNGQVVLALKTGEEVGFTEIFSYNLDFTLLGHIKIMTVDALNATVANGLAAGSYRQGNFSIDNISVTNKDTGRIVVAVDFLSNLYAVPSDYQYEDSWDDSDLLGNRLK